MAQPLLHRRRFLRLALGGAGVVVAGTGGVLALRGSAPTVDGLRCLTPREFRTFEAVASAIVPRGGPFAEGAADADIARAFDDFLADEPERNIADVKKALTLVELGPLLFDGRPTTIWRMDEAARAEHWAGWGTSRLAVRRQVAVGFRGFVSMVFYDRPAAWAQVGYGGPTMGVR